MATLVLNANFTPLKIIPISSISWRDAIKIVYLNNAKVVDYYDTWKVHSPSITLNVPAVIVSNEYIKKKHSLLFCRSNLLLRDNFTCQYCNVTLTSKELTIDHVIPRVKGGKTKWDNVVAACYVCNSIKGHKMSMKPRQKPYKPEYHDLIENAKKMPINIPSEKWIPYLPWKRELIKIVSPNCK